MAALLILVSTTAVKIEREPAVTQAINGFTFSPFGVYRDAHQVGMFDLATHGAAIVLATVGDFLAVGALGHWVTSTEAARALNTRLMSLS